MIIAIVSCYLATYLAVGFDRLFRNYMNKYMDEKLREKIEFLEKRYFDACGVKRVRNEGIIEKFAVHYSDDYEMKDVRGEFSEYLEWNCAAMDGIKSRLECLCNARRMNMTSGGSELWFKSRRPGLAKFER